MDKDNARDKIMDLNGKFSDYVDMSAISYTKKGSPTSGDGTTYKERMRLIRVSDVSVVKADAKCKSDVDEKGDSDAVSPYGLRVKVDNHMVAYLKKSLSPVIKLKNNDGELEDINKLYLGLVYLKVYFEEKDIHSYFPIIMYPIADKQKLYDDASRDGYSYVDIKYDDNLVINDKVVSFFFKVGFEGQEKNISEYIATDIDSLVPNGKKECFIELINHIYDYFKSRKKESNFELFFPEVDSPNSTASMFFSVKSSFRVKREFENLKRIENPLVDEYLEFTQPVNKQQRDALDDSLWLGSLTISHPLGLGQARILQENEKQSSIIPVVGAPGTGKSTLFLSIIANEVTKRALSNIVNKHDYSNAMLVTSTSNKAVENVYHSLKVHFTRGFCYVGGNSDNKEKSNVEVEENINYMLTQEFNETEFVKIENRIKEIINVFKEKQKEFISLKKLLEDTIPYKVYSLDVLIQAKNKVIDEAKVFNQAKIKSDLKNMKLLFSKLSGVYNQDITPDDFPLVIKSGAITKCKEALNQLNNLSWFDKLRGKTKIVLEEVTELVSNKKELQYLVSLYDEINEFFPVYEKSLEEKKKIDFIKKITKTLVAYSDDMDDLSEMLKVKAFGNYFRTKLFKLNYELYECSLSYLSQRKLKEKDQVIKALRYFLSDDPYKYLMDNFGLSKAMLDEFMRLVSLAYPVFTSTLAGVTNMFPSIYPNKTTTYKTVLADEAGMINVSEMLPALARSKRAVIIGDPKQLPPIISIEDMFLEALCKNYDECFWKKYSPSSVSAFHRAAGTINGDHSSFGRGIVLDEHRRCHPEIAGLFIKIAGYGELSVRTPKNTSTKFKNLGERPLFFYDVVNTDEDKSISKVNFAELNVIRKLLTKIEQCGYNLKKDVCIITPFKDQEAVLINTFAKQLGHTEEAARIGTIHKFQGAEFDIVFISSVVSKAKDSLKFLNKDPSLINVALSRGKQAVFMVGDYNKLVSSKKEESNFFGLAAKEIREKGTYVKIEKSIAPREPIQKFTILDSNVA